MTKPAPPPPPDAPHDTIPEPAAPVAPGAQPAPPPQPLIPAILADRDLPGPLSLERLATMGSVSKLDTRSGYWSEHADTLFGRAMIAYRIIPISAIACAFTALWVWMGGAFPDTVDVMSRSHYRTAQHGRRVRVFSRKIARRDLARIGGLGVTRPARTICDIVTIFGEEPDAEALIDPIAECMDAYDFSPNDCITIIDENPCMVTAPQARDFLRDIARVYARRRPEVAGLPPDAREPAGSTPTATPTPA